LEIGDVSRFRTIKHAISYCGLCRDQRRPADKVMRMPLSKRRNKRHQRNLARDLDAFTERQDADQGAEALGPRGDSEQQYVLEKQIATAAAR
jgi:hypothetical protein